MKHQIASKIPTLERLALNRVREQFPQLKRRGFAAALRAAFPDEIEEVSFIPDGWFIDGDLLAGENGGPCAKVICVEIEDRHPLSAEKLWLYCHLYDTLDFLCCDLHLLVFDRYGHNQRELDLCTLYLGGLVAIAHPVHIEDEGCGQLLMYRYFRNSVLIDLLPELFPSGFRERERTQA
jgi:hypothetical protein